MNSFVYWMVVICVVLSYFTLGIYYLWITVIAFFPPIQHCREIPYTDDIDIHFFIVIPCLNEESVIVQAIENVRKTGMKNMRILVVDDDSQDDSVKNILQEYAGRITVVDNAPAFTHYCGGQQLLLLRRHLPDAQKGKGKSLNCAYRLIASLIRAEGLNPHKCAMSVLDADSFLNRRTLERAAVILDREDDVGMVQTRLRIGTFTRDHFLPLFQDIEFFVYINRMQNLREYTGTVSAAGNGQFNRFSAINPDEPWTDCLLEDYDFSMRLLLSGWRTRLLQEDRVFQQGVLTYRKYVAQRARWCQGVLQCLHYCRDIRNSPYISTYGKVESIFFMLLPTVTVLSVFTQLLSWIIIFYYLIAHKTILPQLFAQYADWELAAVLVILLLFVFVPGLIYANMYRRDTGERRLVCVLAGLFQPVYNLMQVPAVLRAVWRQATHQTGWVKTQHFDEDAHRKKKKRRPAGAPR